MNRRLGYRLRLTEAMWPASVPAGGSVRLATTWRNAGVAPCYAGGHPTVTLKDAAGGIAAVFVDQGLDMRSLPVGADGQAPTKSSAAELPLPFQLKPGTYDVLVSVGAVTGTPRIALPLEGGDAQRRYRLGKIEVTAAVPK